jgi:hypothetical protein
MITLLSSGIPYTEKGNLVYFYEEGHRRFVLHCINKAQKLDESMFKDDESDYVKKSFKKVSSLLSYEHKEGIPSMMTKIVYITIILSFIGLITLLVLSDDFLDVISSDLLLITIVTGLILLSFLVVGLASYKYYSHTLSFIQEQSPKIRTMIDDLNASKRHNFEWEMGEMGLWIRLKREDLQFFNEYPEDADDEPETGGPFDEKQDGDNQENH